MGHINLLNYYLLDFDFFIDDFPYKIFIYFRLIIYGGVYKLKNLFMINKI